MELSRKRQRRLIRRLLVDDILDVDIVDAAAIELGLSPICQVVEPVDVVLSPRLPKTTRSDGKGAVYVISAPNGLYKIGSTHDANKRLQTLQTGSSEPLTLVHAIHTTRYLHLALERALHKRLASKRVSGEWFKLDQADLNALLSM